MDPKKWALPKVKMPPSDATKWYPPVGGAAGVAEDSLEAAEGPVALTAFTVKLYLAPLVRPVTVHCEEVHPVRFAVDTAVVGSPPGVVPSYTL
jgi:hypothetical protein